jgi:tetratricopeptide (TPR) repeat protein
MTKPVVSSIYASKISLALQSARACALREQVYSLRVSLLIDIAGSQVRVGNWEGAYREVMSSEETRENTILKADLVAAMAEAQVSIGDFSGALDTIRDALVWAYRESPFFFTLCQIAKVGGKIADEITVHEALDLAERTCAEHLKPIRSNDAVWLTTLAEAQAAGGRREKADNTLKAALDVVSSDGYDGRQEMMDCGYAEIVTVQARLGDMPGALKTLEKMSDRLRVGLGMTSIAEALADSGDFSGALAIVARIDEAEPKTRASIWVAHFQARHGDSVGAQNTLARLELSTNRRERGEIAEASLYLARARVQRVNRDSAPRVLAEILHDVDKAQLHSTPTTAIYAAVGEAYASVGMVEEALRIFERIPGRFERETIACRESLVRMITKAHTVAGNVQVAEAWVLTLPSPSEQGYAWLGIVDGLVSLS